MQLNPNDRLIFNRIKEVSRAEWFLTGEDNPNPELVEFLEDCEPENEHLTQLVHLTASGPDSTDIHIATQELISDLIDEGEDEEEIRESNREMFSTMRAEFFNCINE